MSGNQIIELTAEIVSAHVSNNNVASGDVPALIQSIYAALSKTAEPLVEDKPQQEPAVSVRASVKPDYIVCLEDGAKLKMLKRYLRTRYDLSPDQYRQKWGLPHDYPMVAPNYAEQRRSLAHAIGLGRKKVVEEAGTIAGAVKRAARKTADAVESAAGADTTKTAKPRGAAARKAAQAHLAGSESNDA